MSSITDPSSTFGLILVIAISVLFAYRVLSRSTSSQEKPVQFSIPTPEQALPHWKGKRISPVSIFDPNNPNNIQCYCPATGQNLGSVPAAKMPDMDSMIQACNEAQLKWKQTTFVQRRKVLKTILKYVMDHKTEIARIACRDTGKTMLDAGLGEILVTLEKLNWIIKHGEKILSTSRRPGSSNWLLSYKCAEIRYEPLGVIAAMVSWNYPFHNLMGPVVSALITGNGIILKCSESVVWSSQYFIEIAKQALRVNDFDDSLIQLVCCWPQDADYLTCHPGLSHITFIGSRPVAHKVAVAAAEPLTPVVLELGGKDPLIIVDDNHRDISGLSSVIMRGVFQSAGQNCAGIERVIAFPKVYEGLVPILTKKVSELRLGSSIDQQEDIDIGATISDARYDALEELIAQAVHQGAKLLCGGTRQVHPKYPQGHYFRPTLLMDVTSDMEIAQTEVFGPILLLFKVENSEEAVAIANSTEFGLGASVFGSNYKVINQVADKLRCGNVAFNDLATFYLCQLPFGGVNGSGYGKFNGKEGLRGLCLAKGVAYDRLSFIKTKIPRPLDYPIPDGKKAWEMMAAICDAGYASSFWKRLKALGRLIRS
jgi:acyl-CoA reductase-like NAD-dependent aldehyde dehydrogenase